MRRLFKFRYPKLTALVLCIILAYLLFSDERVVELLDLVDGLGYVEAFVGGLLFSFGFTTPFAVGFFVTLNPSNPLLVAFIGSLGAVIADVVIFKLIKFSFMDEFKQLRRAQALRRFQRVFDRAFPQALKAHFSYAFAGMILASPVPDELGVSLLAGLTRVRLPLLVLVSLASKLVGILILVNL